MIDKFKGKVAVVTGGSSGIGRGIGLALAEAGMHVVATGRRQAHLDETVAEFRAAGLEVHPVQLDVTDPAAVDRVADEVADRFGRVDVLVNNAGIGLAGKVADATPADWDWIIDVNVRGVGHCIRSFLPRIREHGEGGHIVNTASMSGLLPVVAGLYSMTKAAAIALSEAMHIELAPEGICVSAYCPGPVRSKIALGVAERPAKYGESGYPLPDPAAIPDPETLPYMSYREAGRRVLAGMLRRDLFILTHPEFREGVLARGESLLAAFPDEPIDTERASAITFLTGHEVYAAEHRNPPPGAVVVG